MDPSFSTCSSALIESIRNSGIGRRGGVKVRGGRLPPVQIHKALAKNKIIAPKIPQRRVKVKKEETQPSYEPEPSRRAAEYHNQRQRGRGRGRGARVYIQTEGTLLGDGPALQIKKERDYSGYERASVPKYSKTTKIKSENDTIKSEDIEHLLEYEHHSEGDSDSDTDLRPVKFPYVRELKQQIKKESIETNEGKLNIKVESDEDEQRPNFTIDTLEGKFFTRIKTEPLSDNEEETLADGVKKMGVQINDEHLKIPKPDFSKCVGAETDSVKNELLEDIAKMKGEGLLMLLQFPSCLPVDLQDQQPGKSVGKESENKQETLQRLSIHDLPEGVIGKFQILKSGKMRIVMGSTYIYLERSIPLEYLSEVVSIPMAAEEGDIIVMGRIDKKMILRPHISGLTD